MLNNKQTKKSTESDVSEYASFTTKTGQPIKLYLGDCFWGMEHLILPESIDLIVTSPPYNIGINYSQYNDRIPRESYLEWIKQWGVLIKRVLKPDGSLFLNIGSKPSDPWVPFDVAAQLRETFVLQNVIHWIKSIYIANTSYSEKISVNVGHFKPIIS